MAHTYTWNKSTVGGYWSDAANWTDVGTGQPATSPPVSGDTATVGGDTHLQFQILGGPGSAGNLSFIGDTALQGTITATTITVESSAPKAPYSAADAVDVEAGATLKATGTMSLPGNVEADGTGADLAAAVLTQGDAALLAVNHAKIKITQSATIGGDLSLDSTASFAVGKSAGALGVVTIGTGTGLTVDGGGNVGSAVTDNGTLTFASGLLEASVGGPVSGSGAVVAATRADASISSSISGLASVALDAHAALFVAGGVNNVAVVSVGTSAELSIGGAVSGVGTITLGASSFATFSADVSGVTTIEVGTDAELVADGTISGVGGISLAEGAALALGGNGANAALDDGGPIRLSGGNALILSPGADITAAISGFDSTDAFVGITVPMTLGGMELTGAIFTPGGAGGTLTLTDDGQVLNTVSLSGSYAGAQFISDIANLQGGTSEVALAVGTLDAVSANGTVTGDSGISFQVILGKATSSGTQIFLGNNAIEGDYTAGTIGIGGTLSATLNATDIEAGGTLDATVEAVIATGAEIDGAGAKLLVGGTLGVGGGALETELFVLNGGRLQAAGLELAGTDGVASPNNGELVLDATASGEIGTAGTAATAGVLTVDAGATLSGSGLNIQVVAPTIVDNGVIAVLDPTYSDVFVSSLFLQGNVTGSGTLSIGPDHSLFVTGSVSDVSDISEASYTSLTITGTLATKAALITGVDSSTTIDGNTSGLARIQVSNGSVLNVGGELTGTGSVTVFGNAELVVAGLVSGGNSLALDTNATATLDSGVTGLSGISMANTAALSLFGSDANVPISMAGNDLLVIGSGVTIGGDLSGFDISDLLQVIAAPFEAGGTPITTTRVISGAGGLKTLVLLDDTATIDTIALTASEAGLQFLTNSVGLTSGYSDITLPGSTRSGLGGTGAVTVTGDLGALFQVITGTGSATSVTFVGNNYVEGTFSAGTITIGGTSTKAINALDIAAGAALTATATAAVSTFLEVDGVGAALTDDGALTLGGGTPEAELYVLNAARVEVASLKLTGSDASIQPGTGAEILLDGTASMEVGGAHTAMTAGTLAIDAGATLTSAGLNITLAVPNVLDDGSIVVAPPAYSTVFVSSLIIDGPVSGSGGVTMTAGTGLSMGAVRGLSSIAVGASAELTVGGDASALGTITTGASASATFDADLTNFGGVTEGAHGQLTVIGAVSGAGSISIGNDATASLYGAVSGLQGITLGTGATLILTGSDSDVPIVMGADSTLEIGSGTKVGGVIEDFARGDLLAVLGADLGTIVTAGVFTAGAGGNGSLVLSDDSRTLDTLTLSGSYSGSVFLTNAAGQNGVTNVTLAPLPQHV
jgi:hypothetical protein